MTTLSVSATEVMQLITIRIRFMAVLRIRLWLAARIMMLGAWVAGWNVEVEFGEDDEPETK